MDRINWLAIALLLLLGVVVFTANKKDEINIRKTTAISCGPARSANEHHSWPKDDNSGNGCTHQSVSAALLGRVKRNGTHGC